MSSAKYVTISIPKGVAEKIDFLIGELGYWPSRGSFVREACLVKIREETIKLRELREASGDNAGVGRKRKLNVVAGRE